MSKIRVLIADDHSLVREGARQLIDAQHDMEVIGEGQRGDDALRLARELHPDIAIIDISMPELSGIDLITLLRRASPSTQAIVLSVHQEPLMVRRALASGAKAYVVKTAPVSELLQAIRSVTAGRMYLSSHFDATALATLEQTAQEEQPYDLLTEREQQVFRLVVHGRTSQQIADVLCISARTVEKHRAALLHKLGVKDIVGLMRYAAKLGVISDES